MRIALSQLGLILLAAAAPPAARAERFFERAAPTDVRVATWNINFDSVFPEVNSSRSTRFKRVIAAMDADVWAFQEIYEHDASQVKALLDAAKPLGTPEGWYVYKSGFLENTIASRFPLSMTANNVNPPGYREVALALVDLPDARYATDLYMMTAHWKCCGGYDYLRQPQSDAFAAWMRDARNPGGSIALPPGTPMVLAGDVNLVDGPQPLATILDGNIQNNSRYGPDSPPDWDGTTNTAALATHNLTGVDAYTWRDDTGPFAPSRLDYITFTDSAMTLVKSFVLNTVTMTAADRAAASLQQFDSVLSSFDYDHLPVIADFLIPAPPLLAADFDGDGFVDAGDLAAWLGGFATTSGALRQHGDANADGVVDGADLLIWQQQSSVAAATPAAASVPEPPAALLVAAAVLMLAISARRSPFAARIS